MHFLPGYIRDSSLSGNELAKLASVEKIPDYIKNNYDFTSKQEIFSSIKSNIQDNNIDEAWQLTLYLGKILNDK